MNKYLILLMLFSTNANAQQFVFLLDNCAMALAQMGSEPKLVKIQPFRVFCERTELSGTANCTFMSGNNKAEAVMKSTFDSKYEEYTFVTENTSDIIKMSNKSNKVIYTSRSAGDGILNTLMCSGIYKLNYN